ncbi:MAG: divergent polysaccharide deacetylase family protein [Candidatus Marinimicrobia bacterium]|nr:divergent polysaccharide deacetylase family protein [Candidatus Neomarinimicrobiota bacterium]
MRDSYRPVWPGHLKPMSTQQPKAFRFLFIALMLFALGVVAWQLISREDKPSPNSMTVIMQTRHDLAAELEMLGFTRSPRFDPKGGIHFGYPPNMTLDDLMLLLRRIMRDHNLVLTSAVNYEHRRELYVEMSTTQQIMVARFTFLPKSERPPLAEGVRGRIAIIIDDFGYLRNQTTAGFMKLDADITHSIIPGRRYSQILAEESINAGREVIVHMPLEPENYNGRDEAEYMLLYGMSARDIRARVRKAFQTLPQAVGLNNHEGSLASLDTALLDIIASELLDRGKYFVDSFTTPGTRGLDMMRRRGVPSLPRHIFIDNEDEAGYIRQQLAELAASAEQRGYAIGIGHVGASHLQTLEVLRQEIPKLRQQGFEFVFVSELMPKSEF